MAAPSRIMTAFILLAAAWCLPPLYGQAPVVAGAARAQAKRKTALLESQTVRIFVDSVRFDLEIVALKGDPEDEPGVQSVTISNNGFGELVLGRRSTALQAR